MPESYDLMQRLRAAGVPAAISGAGPTVIAVGPPEQLAGLDGRPGRRVRGPVGMRPSVGGRRADLLAPCRSDPAILWVAPDQLLG